MYSFLSESFLLEEGVADKALKGAFDLTTKKGRKFYKFNRQQISTALRNIRRGKNSGVTLFKPDGKAVTLKASDLVNPSMVEMTAGLHPDVQRGFVTRSLVDKVSNLLNGKTGPTRLRGPVESIDTVSKRKAKEASDRARKRMADFIKAKNEKRAKVEKNIVDGVKKMKADKKAAAEKILADEIREKRAAKAAESAKKAPINPLAKNDGWSTSSKVALGLGLTGAGAGLGYGGYKYITSRNDDRV